jgi:hypothetical protein
VLICRSHYCGNARAMSRGITFGWNVSHGNVEELSQSPSCLKLMSGILTEKQENVRMCMARYDLPSSPFANGQNESPNSRK